uniref:LAGLIDADG_2 domain-containing protein n=1 Tax=Strongyloides venezuelensis TaxID=75913 RepID=A0A0K0EZQ4_STRVS
MIRRGKFSNSAHLENNERGTKLELWAESENISIINCLVIKKTSSRITWNGPNKISKSEIDYFLIHYVKKASFIDTRITRRFNVRSNYKPLLLNV